MARSRSGSVLHYLRRVLARGHDETVSDAELLERFVKAADQAAFELLVWRHERMVFAVCRRLLDHHDAEDAFQAVFLVLARKAASIGNRQAVAGWLHRVAYRVANHARLRASRRTRTISQDADLDSLPCPRQPGVELLAGDLGRVLDEEVNRLPEKYRVPVVLCYLEGKTYEEAARQLGCPKGTLSARLTRARRMLQTRFTRRGMALGGGFLAGALCEHAASAAVPAALAAAAVKTVLSAGSSRAALGVIPAEVATLAEGVLRSMLLHKVKFVAVILAALIASLGGGTYIAVLHAGRPGQPAPAEKRTPAHPARARKPRLVDAGGFVHALSWSPDGKLIATQVDKPGTGRALQIRDADTGAVRRTLYEEDNVWDARFSPDGKSVAAALLGENVVKLWNPLTGKVKTTFERVKIDGALPVNIAFSRDGRYLAAAGRVRDTENKGAVILWETGSGKILWQARGHANQMWQRAVAFSPDGKLLATGADGTIKLWETATGKCKTTLQGHEDEDDGVISVAFSPDGKLLASGGLGDGKVCLWDPHSGKREGVLTSGYITAGRWFSVAFSPDGRRLAVGGTALGNTELGRADVRLFDTKTRKLNRAFTDIPSSGVTALAFSPGGETLAVAIGNELLLLPLQ